MAEFWLANAFVGPEAGGNATGVVVLGTPLPDPTCAAVARRLRAPDTVFVTPRGDDFETRFFSPFEGEMSFCGQALIATEAVLRARGSVSGPEVRLHTAVGEVTAWRDEERSGFRVPAETVRELPQVRALRQVAELPGSAPERVVDSGRRRVFRELPSAEAVEGVALEPGRVLAFCRAERLSGICLWARAAADQLALRVFTVSLAGGEDASTGGAVLGLAALLEPGEGPWAIHQGAGHPLRRGLLHLRRMGGELAVGGKVELVGRGELLPATSA